MRFRFLWLGVVFLFPFPRVTAQEALLDELCDCLTEYTRLPPARALACLTNVTRPYRTELRKRYGLDMRYLDERLRILDTLADSIALHCPVLLDRLEAEEKRSWSDIRNNLTEGLPVYGRSAKVPPPPPVAAPVAVRGATKLAATVVAIDNNRVRVRDREGKLYTLGVGNRKLLRGLLPGRRVRVTLREDWSGAAVRYQAVALQPQ